jgi:hypothetical protein
MKHDGLSRQARDKRNENSKGEREREGAFHIMCRTTGGDWKATYGKEGYVLPGFDPSADPEGANQQGIL